MHDKKEKYIDTSDKYILDHEMLIDEVKALLADINRSIIKLEGENINTDLDLDGLIVETAALRQKIIFCGNYPELGKYRLELKKKDAARLRTLVLMIDKR